MTKNIKLILLGIGVVYSFTCKSQQLDINNEYEKGKIENGYKIGVWEYLGINKTIELKIDYDKGTLVYLKPDTSKYYIKPDSDWTNISLKLYPRYIGSYAEFYNILASNLNYPVEARRQKIEKSVFLEFVVNTTGQVAEMEVLNDSEGYFSTEIMEVFKLIPNLWLSANYNGQNVPAKFILPFHFQFTGGKKSLPYDVNALNKLDGKKMHEIVITAPRPK
jgi:hypothetical protein